MKAIGSLFIVSLYVAAAGHQLLVSGLNHSRLADCRTVIEEISPWTTLHTLKLSLVNQKQHCSADTSKAPTFIARWIKLGSLDQGKDLKSRKFLRLELMPSSFLANNSEIKHVDASSRAGSGATLLNPQFRDPCSEAKPEATENESVASIDLLPNDIKALKDLLQRVPSQKPSAIESTEIVGVFNLAQSTFSVHSQLRPQVGEQIVIYLKGNKVILSPCDASHFHTAITMAEEGMK